MRLRLALIYGLLLCPEIARATPVEDVIKAISPPADVEKRSVVVYQFDTSHPIPLDTTGSSSVKTSAWLVTINRATKTISSSNGPLEPLSFRVYGSPNSAKCTDNSNAKIDSIPQTWELLPASMATSILKGKNIFPTVVINANYFDVRAQGNGITWATNKCSRPLGVFYDNNPGHVNNDYGSYDGNDQYLAGPPYFIGKTISEKSPVQSMIFFMGNDYTNPSSYDSYNRQIDIVENNALTDLNFKARIGKAPYNYDDARFTAISGAELLPNLSSSSADAGDGPDSGGKSTTRIAIAYKKSTDQLFIFEGGGYTSGVTRTNLASLFKALGSDVALELDGGGSASVVVNSNQARWAGATTTAPQSGCALAGYTCSKPTQPDGNARPVPAFFYVQVPQKTLAN
ncbi:phosphodiester glycosidase family protein [Acetobacter sacchari]|uniref:Phosphodiester glycosidase family protein n=1 Tax=Acetobacter sacchari TaxID=2661687 RepID=A0ABS3M0L2_9PROT|nr:phosphodiester glycosidase family protein [Acetobacter sacchari]MBO1361703.1 phosphodiester glycosidase family protein [Acetobacter sacchari]